MRYNQLRQKEVINVCEGRSLGCVCDLIFDECKGHIHAIVVPGNSGFCGLFGRQNFVIPLEGHLQNRGRRDFGGN